MHAGLYFAAELRGARILVEAVVNGASCHATVKSEDEVLAKMALQSVRELLTTP
jgi:hypothetical protein